MHADCVKKEVVRVLGRNKQRFRTYHGQDQFEQAYSNNGSSRLVKVGGNKACIDQRGVYQCIATG